MPESVDTSLTSNGLWRRAFPSLLFGLVTVHLALFAFTLRAAAILTPFSDMAFWVLQYLQYVRDGGFWSYLWAPHNQHRIVWIRLLVMFDVRTFGGSSYPLVIFATTAQLLTGALAAYFSWRAADPPWRAPAAALGSMLVLTSVSALDCAIPVFSTYPPAVAFAVVALALLHPRDGTHVTTTRLALAALAAVAASVANGASLVLWPILVWSAHRAGVRSAATAGLAALAVLFVGAYAHGLPAAQTGIEAQPLSMARLAVYTVSFFGLPWTRASSFAVVGGLLGSVLLAAGVYVVIAHGLVAARRRAIDDLGIGLVAFSIGAGVLAVVGRLHVDEQVIVPVRYSVLVAPLHVGLLILALPFLQRRLPASRADRWLPAGIAVLALILVAQQVEEARAAIPRAQAMRDALVRFLAGDGREELKTVIGPDAAADAIEHVRAAHLYLGPNATPRAGAIP